MTDDYATERRRQLRGKTKDVCPFRIDCSATNATQCAASKNATTVLLQNKLRTIYISDVTSYNSLYITRFYPQTIVTCKIINIVVYCARGPIIIVPPHADVFFQSRHVAKWVLKVIGCHVPSSFAFVWVFERARLKSLLLFFNRNRTRKPWQGIGLDAEQVI